VRPASELIAVTANEVFQIVISVALVIVFIVQLGTLFAIYRLVVKVTGLMETVQSKTEPLIEQTRGLLAAAKPILERTQTASQSLAPLAERTQELLVVARDTMTLVKETTASLKVEAEACIAAVSATTREVARLTGEQAQELSDLVGETSERLRHQVAHFDRVASRTALRIDDTAAIVQRDVLRPVTEVSAVLAAAKSFLETLMSPGPKQPEIDKAYHDEEMFI
jgi:uncharacterized protein YoxC